MHMKSRNERAPWKKNKESGLSSQNSIGVGITLVVLQSGENKFGQKKFHQIGQGQNKTCEQDGRTN